MLFYLGKKMKYQVVSDDFWDLRELEYGTIVYDTVKDWTISLLRLLIMRGTMSWCSYIGVALDSPLSGLSYQDDILSGFSCHGGLTFAGEGDDINRPAGWYYFGWDYGHGGDWTSIAKRAVVSLFAAGSTSPVEISTDYKRWTFGEVKGEITFNSLQMKEIITLRMKEILASLKKSNAVFPTPFLNRKRLIRVNGAEKT